jgi:dihydroorotase
MAPPLRSARDVEALQEAVASGLIDLIATDHAPHGEVDKAVEFDQAANGIIGLQTALSVTLDLVHRGMVSPLRWVDALSTRPAKLLKLPYGTLRPGAIADITIIDPHRLWTFDRASICSKSHNSPYLGHSLKGQVRFTLVGGQIAYEQRS